MNVDIVSENTIIIELHHLLHEGVRQAQHQNRSILVSLSERIWPLDAIELFHRSRLHTTDRFFLAQPDEDFVLVGLGIAQAIDAVVQVRVDQTGEEIFMVPADDGEQAVDVIRHEPGDGQSGESRDCPGQRNKSNFFCHGALGYGQEGLCSGGLKSAGVSEYMAAS